MDGGLQMTLPEAEAIRVLKTWVIEIVVLTGEND
jgi:hypothetical protein